MSTLSRTVWRWLVVVHRWIGVATCLLAAMWFVSGLVMAYAPFPELSREERLEGLEPIDFDQVAISPDAALAAAGLGEFPRSLSLEMLAGRPVYRIVDQQGVAQVRSARDGGALAGFDAAMASDVARRFGRAPQDGQTRTLERDQWTVSGAYNGDRPLHRVDLADRAGTQVYVSSRTGAVVLTTDRRERAWNWAGSVPHWLYFTALRQNGGTWAQVVMWSSGLALAGALTGLWLGISRIRPVRRYPNGAATPYRGWMAWHHVAGVIGGVTTATWLLSGWLSMNPFGWLETAPAPPGAPAAYAAAKGAHHATRPPLGMADAREVRFIWVDGTPLVVLSDGAGARRVTDTDGRPFAFSDVRLRAAAARLQLGAKIAFVRRLTDWDSYWYEHKSRRVLPVLRVGFDDPARTWVHIDPATGEVVGRSDRSGRGYRWLFSALHRFDLGPLIHHRPAWDLVIWTLSILGLTLSISGVVIAWRRLRRKLTPRALARPTRPG